MKHSDKKALKFWILIGFFAFILIDAFFVSRNLLLGVRIRNVNIEDGSTFTESLLVISGNAKNALNLSLNNHEIPIDEDGNFKETVALNKGYNIVTIEAKDKFGKSDKETFRLFGSFAE